jgi:transposase
MHLKVCLVDGVWGQVYLKRLTNGDLLYLFGTLAAKYLGQVYRRRWTIEACFQSLKRRGFNLKSTHLKNLNKLKKLVALVSIAFGMCVSLGIHQHERVKKIKTKNMATKPTASFAMV